MWQLLFWLVCHVFVILVVAAVRVGELVKLRVVAAAERVEVLVKFVAAVR